MAKKKQQTGQQWDEKTNEVEPIPRNPSEKFKGVAELRTSRVLNDLRLLRKAIESPVYEMTQPQVEAIQNAVFVEANQLLIAFGNRKDVKKKAGKMAFKLEI